MAFQTEQTTSEFTVLGLGWYTAVVVDAEAAEGQYGPQCKMILAVPYGEGEDYEEISLWAWTSQKFNQRSKLYAYTAAILDRPIEEGEGFDSDKLVGLCVDVKVDTYEKVEKDGSRTEKNKVLGMRPATQQVALVLTDEGSRATSWKPGMTRQTKSPSRD